MDIASYIIKFLLKNRYCNLPGIGAFDLVKKGAILSEDKKEIQPPRWEIAFLPPGSLDDSFASFIANNENVSISNASNHLKEFCLKVKEELQQSGTYILPHLGTLRMSQQHVGFEASKDLDAGMFAQSLPPLDFKVADQANRKLDFSYPAPQRRYRRKKIPMGKVLGLALAVLLLCILVYVIYRYSMGSSKNDPAPVATAPTLTAPPAKDSSGIASAPAGAPAQSLYKVVVYESRQEQNARNKAAKWKTFGHLTEVQMRDSQFVVSILASHPMNDTTMLKDSLRRFFNPKGAVYILK